MRWQTKAVAVTPTEEVTLHSKNERRECEGQKCVARAVNSVSTEREQTTRTWNWRGWWVVGGGGDSFVAFPIGAQASAT